ncbi:hypothetical protein CSQ88_10290 [Iodobacter sp. BJB302]|nr:hypothetical protein CSQ88_10290 [Iodobacter sp. BJB302]
MSDWRISLIYCLNSQAGPNERNPLTAKSAACGFAALLKAHLRQHIIVINSLHSGGRQSIKTSPYPVL